MIESCCDFIISGIKQSWIKDTYQHLRERERERERERKREREIFVTKAIVTKVSILFDRYTLNGYDNIF